MTARKRSPNKWTKKTKVTRYDDSAGKELTLSFEQWCARRHLSWNTVRMRIRARGGLEDIEYILSTDDHRHEGINWNWSKDRPRKSDGGKSGIVSGKPTFGSENPDCHGNNVLSAYGRWELLVRRGIAKCWSTGNRVTDIWQCRSCLKRCRFSSRSRELKNHVYTPADCKVPVSEPMQFMGWGG